MNVESLRKMLERGEPVTVVDVRKGEDRAEWEIPGSVHFDAYDALNASDERAMEGLELPEGTPVVTVCSRGRSSTLAAEQPRSRYRGATLRWCRCAGRGRGAFRTSSARVERRR